MRPTAVSKVVWPSDSVLGVDEQRGRIGCVGILKEWLVMALASMFGRGANRLERKDLDVCALSVNQCDKLLSECIEGETRLQLWKQGLCHARSTPPLAPLPNRQHDDGPSRPFSHLAGGRQSANGRRPTRAIRSLDRLVHARRRRDSHSEPVGACYWLMAGSW